jgi:hypothetical protein
MLACGGVDRDAGLWRGAMGAGCLSLNPKQHNKMRPSRYTHRLDLKDVPATRHSCLTQKRRGVGGIRSSPQRRKRLVRDFHIRAQKWTLLANPDTNPKRERGRAKYHCSPRLRFGSVWFFSRQSGLARSVQKWRARGSHPASKAYEASQSTGSPAACRIYLNQTHETWIGSRFHRNRISRVSLRYDRHRRYQLLPALTHPEV